MIEVNMENEYLGDKVTDEEFKNTQLITTIYERKVESDYYQFLNNISSQMKYIRGEVKKIELAHKTIVYFALGEAYKVYRSILDSEFKEDMLSEMRKFLIHELGQKVQKNTPLASLIIRYCWADALPSTKTISIYSDTLESGLENNIGRDDFFTWITNTTINKAVESHKKILKETYQDRLARARVLILRMMEIRETQAITSFSIPAYKAENHINQGTNLCVMLGTASRKFDRENFYAEVNLTMFLPVNIDLETLILDRYAKYIEPHLEDWEEQASEYEEKIWSNNIYEFIQSAENKNIYFEVT
jgi:hypothetical protein